MPASQSSRDCRVELVLDGAAPPNDLRVGVISLGVASTYSKSKCEAMDVHSDGRPGVEGERLPMG